MPFDVGPTFNGKVDEVRVRASAVTEGRLRTEALNYLAPQDFYGIGSEDSADSANQSPVALPTLATVDQDVLTSIPFTARAVEPEAQAKTLVSVTQPANGVSSINLNEPRYRSDPDFSGEDRFTATVRDPAGKLSTAPIIVTVEAPPAIPTLDLTAAAVSMTTAQASVPIPVLDGAEVFPAGAATPTIRADGIIAQPAGGLTTVVNPGAANASLLYTRSGTGEGIQTGQVRASLIEFPEVTAVANFRVDISNVDQPPTESPFDGANWTRAASAVRFVSTGNPGGDGLTAGNPMSLAAGLTFLRAGSGRQLTLLPGNYGNPNLGAADFPGDPAIIRAQNRAFTPPGTLWVGDETVATAGQRAIFGGFSPGPGNLILDGLYCTNGNTNPGSRQLWRFCHFFETQFLMNTGNNTLLGVDRCFVNRPRTGTPQADYGLRIHTCTNFWMTRCLVDGGSWNHATSIKNRVTGGVLDCFFRAGGSTPIDIAQSGDYQQISTGRNIENSSPSIVCRRCIFQAAGQQANNNPYRGIRSKNADILEITDCEFRNGLAGPIDVRYIPPSRDGDFFGSTDHRVRILGAGPQRVLIAGNSFAGGVCEVYSRGRGADEVHIIRDNTGNTTINHHPFVLTGDWSNQWIVGGDFDFARASLTTTGNGAGVTINRLNN
jgi:hypothetical protein